VNPSDGAGSGPTTSTRTVPLAAIIGGAVGGFACLALVIGIILCRHKRLVANILRQKDSEHVLPFTITHPDPATVNKKPRSKFLRIASSTSRVGFLSATTATTSKSRLGTGSRINDDSHQPQQPNYNTKRDRIEGTSSTGSYALAPGHDVDIRQELEDLRAEVRQLGVQRDTYLRYGDVESQSPPEYS
jgi:hypothetical protein